MLGIYTRVSTDEQANKGVSLDNQELRGKELAAKLGIDFKVYSDAGLSGSLPFNKRPALNALIDDIYSKKITSVFVFDLNRLSRGDMVQITGLKNIFKTNNTRLYELGGEIDLKDINIELLTDLRSLINAFYIKQTSATIKSNLEKNVRDGKVTGGPLLNYGYTKDANKKLIIDENEVEIVREIYKLALEGKGTKVIAGILNEKGYKTKRGNVVSGKKMMVKGKSKTEFIWRDAVVYRILTGTIYKGKREYKGNIYDAPELAIIDNTTFDLVQEQLSHRDQFKNTTNKYKFLLKGLIECYICKGRYYGHKRANGNDHAYTCNSNRYGKNCGNKGIDIDYLENLVIEHIKNLGEFIEYTFNELYKQHKNAMYNKYDYINRDMRNAEQLINDANTRMENLLKMAEQAGLEPSIFKDRFIQINEELKLLNAEKERIDAEKNFEREKDNAIKVAKEGAKEFSKLTTFEEKSVFIRNLIKSIIILWDEKGKRYFIKIIFKIHQLDNFMLGKELIIDRNKRENGKVVSKILSENVFIENVLISRLNPKEESIFDGEPYASYNSDYLEKANRKIINK